MVAELSWLSQKISIIYQITVTMALFGHGYRATMNWFT